MKRRILLMVAAVLYTGGQLIAEEPLKPETNTIAWLQFVAAELRELRRELLEDRLERQETRVREVDRELLQARAVRQDGEDVQRTQSQELRKLDERVGDPALPAEERAQLTALRIELMAQDQADAAPTQKEMQIGEQLRREQRRLDSLRALARALAPPATGTQH